MFPVYLKDAGFEPPDDPIHYLVTADGLFLVKENPVFRSCVRVRGIRGLQGQKDEVHWKLPPIPGELLQRIVGLFREVYRRHKSEAIVLLLSDPATQEYELCVPEQYVAGGHLTYVPGPTPPGKIRVGTIHSHAEADAFHSPVDDGDEAHDDGLHVTVGNLHGTFSLSCSLVVDGRRFPLKSRDVFEPVPRETVPEIWYEALTHIHAEPPPRDSLDGKPSAI
ncbi:MAG: hypothetical protein HY803_04045 [candidate division NC10 bacterium]|nr:hypothetical protein [candidate division NC10 bacterium]